MKHIKKSIKRLTTSSGEESSIIMKQLGLFLKSCTPSEKTTFSSNCIENFPKATEKRKGSLAFLITLANVDKKLIKDLLKDTSPIIREQTVKGLLYQGGNYLLELEKRLNEETLYRIKKWILLALGNVGSKEAIKIIEKVEVEPQLFSTKEKILSKFKTKKTIQNKVQGRNGEIIIQTVEGCENEWLKFHKIKGVRLGKGIIRLNEEFKFDKFANCRSIFYYGILIGKISDVETVLKKRFGKSEKYCVNYVNEVQGEKEKLSIFQEKISKLNWKYNSKAPLRLQMLNENEAIILIKPYMKESLEYLPASINRVVASCVSLIAKNHIKREGKIIMDPCCGAGTLLCEANKINKEAKLIGIDKDKKAIKKAKKNASEYNIKIDLYNKKFEEVLLVRAPDLVMCNPPFENRVKGEFSYDKLIKFISKNSTRDASIVIYTVKKEELRKACKNNSLIVKKEVKMNLKKISPSVFIIEKVS